MKNAILKIGKRLGLFFRGINASNRRLPDFIIAGVQKGGTTSLYAYLDQHPDLKLSRPKEVHFFDDQYQKGMTYYRRFFPLERGHRKTGEASPYYIFHPHVARRIKKELPEVKIIVALRNPIMRAYSHFHMQRRQGLETLETFEKAIEAEDLRLAGEYEKMKENEHYYSVPYRNFSYKARGMYAHQVERWLGEFRMDQMLFLKSEKLLEDPKTQLKRVYAFLGLKEIYPENLSKKHAHDYPEISKETFDLLTSAFKEDQEKLMTLLGSEFQWF